MRMQRLSDDAIAKTLGEVLRERRLRKNITQDQLAEEVGVSTPTLHKLEKGKGSIALLISVLRALNCLELLDALLSPPRASPLAVVSAGKFRRIRAAGTARVTASAKNISTDTGSPNFGEGLLIPRRQ